MSAAVAGFGSSLVVGDQYTIVVTDGGFSGTVQDSATFTVKDCAVTPPPVTPASPIVSVVCDHCSDAKAANGSATIKVTNPGKVDETAEESPAEPAVRSAAEERAARLADRYGKPVR